MKLLLLADNLVGHEVTEWLLANYPSDIGLVVTTSANEIFVLASNAEVPVVVFESSAQVAAHIASMGTTFDIGLLVWWPTLIRQPLLGVVKHGLINTHPSLLPHNRGKHYNFWALVEQAPFGVTLHFVDEGVDSGDIVAQAEIPYDWTDTGETLFLKARGVMMQLVRDTYPVIRTLQVPRCKQNTSYGSFHLAKELESASVIHLDQSYRARDLLNLLRARTFPGHPSCSFVDDNNNEFEVRVDIRRKGT